MSYCGWFAVRINSTKWSSLQCFWSIYLYMYMYCFAPINYWVIYSSIIWSNTCFIWLSHANPKSLYSISYLAFFCRCFLSFFLFLFLFKFVFWLVCFLTMFLAWFFFEWFWHWYGHDFVAFCRPSVGLSPNGFGKPKLQRRWAECWWIIWD